MEVLKHSLDELLIILQSKNHIIQELKELGLSYGHSYSNMHLFVGKGEGLAKGRCFLFKEKENGRGKEYEFWFSR